MDGQCVQESLAQLQKCWRGAKPSNSVMTPLSVSPWCTLSSSHAYRHPQVHLQIGTSLTNVRLKTHRQKSALSHTLYLHIDWCAHTCTWTGTGACTNTPLYHCLSTDTFITPSSLLYNQHQSLLSHSYHHHHKHTGCHTDAPTHKHTQVSWVMLVCIALLLVLKWVIYPSTASLQPARANTISRSLCLSRWRERETDIQ